MKQLNGTEAARMNGKSIILILISVAILFVSPVSADFWQTPIVLFCMNSDGSGFVPGHANPQFIADGDITTYIQSNSSSSGNQVYCRFEFTEIRKMKTHGFYFGGTRQQDTIYNEPSFVSTNNSDWSGWVSRAGLTLSSSDKPASYPGWYNRSSPKTTVPTEKYIEIGHNMGSPNPIRIYEEVFEFFGTSDYLPIVNFTGTPVSGPAPLSVTFTSTNITNTTGVSWSFGDGNITTGVTATQHLYINPGIYTVRLDYYNSSGVPGYVQKNNYITVGAPNATSTTHAVARDLYTGFAINGAQVDMYDVENTSWTNTTAINGEGSITTLLGHTINIWGSATGYDDDNLIGVPEVDGGYYSLLLKPTNLTTHNVTPGNLTLAVTVQDLQIPHQTLSGAEVTAAWGAQYASGTSNAAGSVFFTVPNNTAIHLSAFKSGYASGSSTHITGSANGGSTMETAIVYIGTDYVTPVPSVTLTTGPGGTIPQTVDPYPCIGDGSAQDTANCQRKQGSMAADLISYGPDLVKFFIMLTFIGGLLLITGKR